MRPVTRPRERFARIAGIAAVFCLAVVMLLPMGIGGTSTTRDSIGIEIVETTPDSTDDSNIRNTGEIWLELFENAEHTIDIEAPYFYSYQSGDIADAYNELVTAAGRGVQIRILANTWDSDLNYLAANDNIEVLVPSEDEVSVHAKYFIVDDRKVFVGSQNWSYTAVESNHELGLLIENEQVAGTYTYIFESGWEAAGGETRGAEYWEADWIYPVACGPEIPDNVKGTLVTLEELIHSAEESVKVFVYVFSTGADPLATALLSAANRGVEVQLMTDAWYYQTLWPEKNLDDSINHSERLDGLADVDGISIKIIYLEQYSRAHQKIVVVDGERAYLGSANWTSSSVMTGSTYKRREVGVWFEDSTLASALSDSFDAYWNSEYTKSVGETSTSNDQTVYIAIVGVSIAVAVAVALWAWGTIKRRKPERGWGEGPETKPPKPPEPSGPPEPPPIG